jgi:hypothetical protein
MSDNSVPGFGAAGEKDLKPAEMCANAILLIRDCKRLDKVESSGAYILLSHAIELLLKAYLHKQGGALDGLPKKYRHGMVELLNEARAKGLGVSDQEADSFISRLDLALDRASLRYEFYFQDLPGVDRLLKFSDALANDVNRTTIIQR